MFCLKTLENLILLRVNEDRDKNAQTETYDFNALAELRDKASLIASNRDESQRKRFEAIKYFEDVSLAHILQSLMSILI